MNKIFLLIVVLLFSIASRAQTDQTCHFNINDTTGYKFPSSLTPEQNIIDTSNLTIQCWFKSNTLAGERTIFSYCYYPSFTTTIKNGMFLKAGNDTLTAKVGDTTLQYVIPDTNWHHVALTRNAQVDTINLFIDGIKVGSNYSDFSPTHVAAGITVGNTCVGPYAYEKFWNGNLTEFRIDTAILFITNFIDTCHYPHTFFYVAMNNLNHSDIVVYGTPETIYLPGITNTSPCGSIDPPPTHSGSIEIISQEIAIAPNPATNQIVITSNTPINNVRIQKMTGQVLRVGNYNDVKVTVDLENLANGMYIVMVDNKPYKILKQ